MALNTDALINATYMQTLFEDAWFVARDENIMARLALNFVESDEAKTRTASAHDEATMVAIGETDDLQSQTFTPSTGEVLTPADAIERLIAKVRSLNLHKGTENSLIAKLESAIKSLDKGKDNAAVNKLGAFVNEVEAQSGKKIGADDASDLIADVARIIAAINGDC